MQQKSWRGHFISNGTSIQLLRSNIFLNILFVISSLAGIPSIMEIRLHGNIRLVSKIALMYVFQTKLSLLFRREIGEAEMQIDSGIPICIHFMNFSLANFIFKNILCLVLVRGHIDLTIKTNSTICWPANFQTIPQNKGGLSVETQIS